MAQGKIKKEAKRSTDFHFGGVVRSGLVSMGNDTDKNKQDVPISFLIALVVMCIVLVIALPIMGIMYLDMNNATVAAMNEIKKMRELRAKILLEMRGE